MDRARESARQQGSAKGKPKKRASQRKRSATDPIPYGRGRDPVPVGDAIPALADRMGWTEQMEIASITEKWEDIVGEDIARHCEIVCFDSGVLTVQASSTAWAEQLTIMSGRMRQRVNEEIGSSLVTTIQVRRPSTRSWVKGPRNVKGRGPRDTYG